MTAKPVQPKYIFVVGGVMSGVGKGVTASSLGTILQARGYRVTAIKIDPYLNVDAGTMNPIEHGEVFVLDSGLETDQDMGNYERFLNMSLPSDCYMTNGMVYKYVIDKERALGYGGKCVDPVPYICQEITRRINRAVEKTNAEIAIVEIGGTVGEYQNAMFIEAARIMKIKHPKDVAFVLVSYLPVPGTLGEMKTKPTQYAVRTLNSNGVHPDIIIARATRPLDRSRKEKIALSSNVGVEDIISAPDVSSIYDIPLNFEKDKLSTTLLKLLSLRPRRGDLKAWKQMVQRQQTATKTLPIAIIGKYFRSGDYVLSDAYISVIEAIKHAGMALKVKPEISWLTAEEFEDPKNLSQLKQYAGIIVPGGFGERGIEGKLNAIRFAREHKIPYFGLCYGMQLLVIEYARNVAKIKDAQTTEIDPKSKAPVIDIMPEQRQHLESGNFGGSMRLGSYLAKIKPNTIAADAYGKKEISERHRHRYEVNPEYIEQITDAGLVFSGTSPDGVLMEIAELPQTEHPFFLGTQFHPEFLSRPLEPHPLFVEFMKAAKGK